jgi:carboxymethylenebutenolidase
MASIGAPNARAASARALLDRCGLEYGRLTDEQAVAGAEEIAAAAMAYRAATRPDLAAVFDEHVADEFERRDVDATMATMAEDPYVDHVPVMTGGVGREEVRRFYSDHFIGKWPPDTEITQLSRTVGESQVVDELILSFTHDIEMDAILPRVPPTGRRVELPHAVVMAFEGGRVAHEHIYWDQATALVQVGLLEPDGLPVTGAEQAHKLLDKSLPSNTLLAHRD